MGDDEDAVSPRGSGHVPDRVVGRSLAREEAAGVVGVDPAVLDLWSTDGRVYSVVTAMGVRFPSWQFTTTAPGTGCTPGWLPEIVAAIPADIDPLVVEAVMTVPAAETGGRAPLAWLSAGGALDPVVLLLRDLTWLG